jgi:hypothetical protein
VGKGLIKGSREVGELLVNMSAVGLPVHGTSLEELLKVLKARLLISRNSIYHQLDFNKNNFDHLCDEIFRIGKDERWKGEGIYFWSNGGEKHFLELLSLFFEDIKIYAGRRGVFYTGNFNGREFNPIEKKDDYAQVNTRIYIFFSENKELFEMPGIINVGCNDDSSDLKFILYLNEHYAFFCMYKDGRYFESNDALLVEAMISRLQIEYYLQWQL